MIRATRSTRLLLVLLALVVAGCGGDERSAISGQPTAETPPATDSARLEHIHGLGADPRSGTLYVATHYGLFQADRGSTKLTRLGESTQDVMGFSVVSTDRFIGSGHPDPSQELPPNLGLIESRDGGRTWKNISLLGDADFHVLRSDGPRVYGFDGTQGRLMVSSDSGRTWKQRAVPAGVYDLAIDPADRDRIVASTERGLYVSSDAGEAWRPVNDQLAGLLAWSTGDALFLVDGQGQAMRSTDGGKTFASAGSVGGQPVAFAAADGQLYAALADGTVKQSADAGSTWTVRAAP
jgi:photosystem II stability/assembly factor-like uncharacterized protein